MAVCLGSIGADAAAPQGTGRAARVAAPAPAASRPASQATPAQQAAARFDGEYGLYVGLVDGGLDVRWLSADSAPGVARALVDGRVVAERRTDPGTAHAAILEVDGSTVVIEYGVEDGSDNGELHRTEIRLDRPRRPETDLSAADSVYVFGDVHGQFDRIITLLRGAGLIDPDLRWTGGSATVALLGDLFDRGDDVTRTLWFLYRLEAEAAAAGGRVVVVLGNHEVMVMSGDLRYVSDKEERIGIRHGLPYGALFDPAGSVLGRWLAGKPGLVRVDDLLMAHGGVSPTYADYSLDRFQDSLGAFIAESLFVAWHDEELLQRLVPTSGLDTAGLFRRYDFFFSPESVLWYRDLVLTDTLAKHLEKVLDRFDVDVHVVAHTPVRTIQERYEGRLIAVDLLDAAAEMLLLVRRDGGGWARFKVPLDGPPEPLGLVP